MSLGNFPLQAHYFSYIFSEFCDSDLSDLKKQQKLDNEFHKSLVDLNRNYIALKDQFVLESSNPIVKSIYEICENFYLSLRKMRFELLQELERLIDQTMTQTLSDHATSLIYFLDQYWYIEDFLKKDSFNMHIESLESPNGIVNRIKEAVKQNGSFTNNMVEILRQVHSNETDNFLQFRVLYCALKTLISTLFFMLEKHAFLAEHYFQLGDISKFNSCLQSLARSFQDYQARLFGNSEQRNNGLIEKLKNFAKDLQQRQAKESEVPLLAESLELLEHYAQMLQAIKLPFILQQPDALKYKPNFRNCTLQTPIGLWKSGQKVSYNVQYESNGVYTQLAPLSLPFLIGKQANPKIHVPSSSQGQGRRLVYRKFDGCSSIELVAILEDEQQESFQDLTRDLFNAAKNSNEELALKEFKIYLKNGADIRAVFENGNGIWHAAAAAGNVKIAENFLLGNNLLDINAKNAANKTALDVAAENGHQKFVELLKENGGVLSFNKKLELHATAYRNQALRLQLLLATASLDPNESDEYGFTAVHYAVFGGAESIQVLLNCTETKIDFNAQSYAGLTALHLAVLSLNDKVVRLLIACKKVKVNAPCKMGITALHFAAMKNDAEMTELLLTSKKIDVNATANNGWTALHLAVARHAKSVINVLLKSSGINVNATLAQNLTPLHLAAITKSETMADILLENGAAINAQTNEGITPLHIVARFNIPRVVCKLLEACANLELKTKDGLTVLLMAVSCGSSYSDIIKLLIDSGADISAADQAGLTFEWLAAEKGTYDIMKYISKRYTVSNLVDNAGNNLLHHATKAANLNTVAYFLKKQIFDINTENKNQETALHLAVKNGNLELIKMLLANHANTEVKDKELKTPLLHAAIDGRMDIVKCLLENGASILQQDTSALHYAARAGNLDLVKFLIETQQVNANQQNLYGETPLFYAIEAGHLNIVKYLIEVQNIDINISSIDKRKPLHKACYCGFLDIVRYLLEAQKVDINAKDDLNYTPLHTAVQGESLDVVKYMLENGANINERDVKNSTVVHFAAQSKNLSIIKYLIEEVGLAANPANDFGSTPIFEAAFTGRLDVIRYLVELDGMAAHAVNKDGQTPLWFAVSGGHFEIIKYLIEAEHVCVNLRDKNNKSLLDIAEENSTYEISEYLKLHEAI